VRVGVRERVNVILGVSVLVNDGVSVSVGGSVSDAVSVGIEVRVGVRETSPPNSGSPIDMMVPSRSPMTVLICATPITTTLLSPAGKLRTPLSVLPHPVIVPSSMAATEYRRPAPICTTSRKLAGIEI